MKRDHLKKAVICAGGKGTRLLPLTKSINKHLLPIGRVPMILYVLKQLIKSGIEEVAIVTTPEGMTPISSFLGSGKEYGCKITYFCQDNSLGIPDAILCAQDFIGCDPFVVVLGDNIFFENLREIYEEFLASSYDGFLILNQVENPQQFGIARIENGRITEIQEKPIDPPTNLCVTGIYLYQAKVLEEMKNLKFSQRNELEISELNSELAKSGRAGYKEIKTFWIDAGTLDDYVIAFQKVADAD